jgi:hypothetical protein
MSFWAWIFFVLSHAIQSKSGGKISMPSGQIQTDL